MQTLITLLQSVLVLLMALQGNPNATADQKTQAINAATQVVTLVQQAVSSGAVQTLSNTTPANTVTTGNTYNPYSTALGYNQTASNYRSDPTAIDSLGTATGLGTVGSATPRCDQSLAAQSAYAGQVGNQSANPPLNVACAEVGKSWIGSIDYQGSNGACYHADWTGTYSIDCSKIQSITGFIPAQLPNGQMPTNPLDSTVNWSSYNAKCYYTQGDLSANLYLGTYPIICGVDSHANTQPTASQITAAATTTNPYSTASNALSKLAQAYVYSPTAIDYLGTPTGAGTVGSNPPQICNATYEAQSAYAGQVGNADNVPLNIACAEVGKAFVGSIDYQGSNGACYHADWTGTYSMDCNVLKAITGAVPPALPNGQFPSNALDSTFTWGPYNAKCYYTQGDLSANLYLGTYPIICGANAR